MAEENAGAMPDFSDAELAIPPIDNIHAPKPEPDLVPASSHGQPEQPFYAGGQLDTEMREAAVRSKLVVLSKD